MAADPPTDDDIQQLVERIAQRLVRLLQRRGLLDEDRTDPLAQDQPLLAVLTAAAVRGTVATGPRAGQRLRRRLTDPPGSQRTALLCYAARGFSLHAATRVAAHDRTRLEQLCRYVLRPPLAAARLRWLAPDTLSLTLKTPWADGTTHLLLSPHELLEKLAALVPPPRQHLIRYHGVLAPHAADRAQIVPAPAHPVATHRSGPPPPPVRLRLRRLRPAQARPTGHAVPRLAARPRPRASTVRLPSAHYPPPLPSTALGGLHSHPTMPRCRPPTRPAPLDRPPGKGLCSSYHS